MHISVFIVVGKYVYAYKYMCSDDEGKHSEETDMTPR